jgi:hypothetical protein
MAQCVRRHPLLDLGHGGGGMNGTTELPRGMSDILCKRLP